MYQLISRAYRAITHVLAPPFCARCKLFLHEQKILCERCVRRIKPVVSHTLEVTKTKKVPVLAIGAYQQPLSSLILAKSSSQRVVSTQLGMLLWQMSNVRAVQYDYIVPIPLHWTRYAWRGYNQSTEIARVISLQSKKPMVNLLRRTKQTPYLTYYSSEVRSSTMHDAFVLRGNVDQYRGKHLLLVDDVMTTGATLKEAAKTLWKLRPLSITAVVIARVVR